MSAGLTLASAALLALAGTPVADAGDAGDRAQNLSLIASLPAGSGGDLAFWENFAAVSFGDGEDGDHTDDGFILLDVSHPTNPKQLSRFDCNGSGFDIAIWKDLVFLATQYPLDGPGCQAELDGLMVAPYAGVRVVSIADPYQPRQVAFVRTNGRFGAHTLSVLPDLEHKRNGQAAPRVLVYANGADPGTIIEVPLKQPADAKPVGTLTALPTAPLCHDLSFFVPLNLGLCAGVDESQVWDMRDPLRPQVLSHIVNPLIHHNHSAAFSWDGRTVVISEENLENMEISGCPAGTASPQGALWFYDVSDPRLPRSLSSFQLPGTQTSDRYCSAHQMQVVPLVGGRDVVVAGWYGGGTTVVDFTDPTRLKQIGYFQGDPDDDDRRSMTWASYLYRGHVYVNNVVTDLGIRPMHTRRGLDVLAPHGALGFLEDAMDFGRFNFGLQDCGNRCHLLSG